MYGAKFHVEVDETLELVIMNVIFKDDNGAESKLRFGMYPFQAVEIGLVLSANAIPFLRPNKKE